MAAEASRARACARELCANKSVLCWPPLGLSPPHWSEYLATASAAADDVWMWPLALAEEVHAATGLDDRAFSQLTYNLWRMVHTIYNWCLVPFQPPNLPGNCWGDQHTSKAAQQKSGTIVPPTPPWSPSTTSSAAAADAAVDPPPPPPFSSASSALTINAS